MRPFTPYREYAIINTEKAEKSARILFDAMNYDKKDKKNGTRYLYGQIIYKIIGKEVKSLELK